MYLLFLFPFLLLAYTSNNCLSVSTHRLSGGKRQKHPSSLSLVHISDLHNKSFGPSQSRLIKKIKSLHPDLIAVTGDIVDRAPYQNAVLFLRQAARICPVYYVRGNHEAIAGNFSELKKELASCGVHILKNRSADFQKDGCTYQLTGLDDPIFRGKDKNYAKLVQKTLDRISKKAASSPADYRILLSHRPELFHLYSSYPFDLVLCGHAHGGQFRPPFTDGLYAPNQGVFPKYTSGAHRENHTTEIISRGLGNSSFPLRLWNHPEIVHIVIR